MTHRDHDEMGLPLRGERNPQGNLTVRLSEKRWAQLAMLKSKWEADRTMMLTLTDCVGATIEQAFKANGLSLPPVNVAQTERPDPIREVAVPKRRKRKEP